jgi:lipopolysaccharide export system protein LptA
MAAIKNNSTILFSFKLKHILALALILPFAGYLQSQEIPAKNKGKKTIFLKYADVDIMEKDSTGNDVHRLIGNVNLEHENITMTCDSAHLYFHRNQVMAYSKVHVQQGDTLDLYGDYIFYDGKTELAVVKGNVELVDKETHLYTQAIDYDTRNKVARYNDKGRITNADNVLTSRIGIYYVSQSLAHFKDSVKIVNPDYTMNADTMDYNTNTETAFFTGPTKLKGDSLNLYCEKGWFDTKNDITSLWKKAEIDNMQQKITGDSLFYDKVKGFGESFGNVVIKDSTNNLIVSGNYAWYYKQPEKFLVTKKAMFTQVSKKDSLFLHADTISATTTADSAGKEFRLMKAYHGCRMFSQDFQSKCDSLAYSFQDSVIRLYYAPVIWSEENQLTSDSMAIFTKNRQPERLELYSSAFITSQVDTFRFNQIKGRSLTGYFRDNELYKIDIRGNGESIYYLLEGEFVAGINQAKCANIEVLVEKGKISEIIEYQNPEGTIDPPIPIGPEPLRLKGFQWLDKLRPKKKNDIFN